MPATLRSAAGAMAAELTQWRRHLHAHPELSFAEHETAAYIRAHLDRLGIPHTSPAGTSVVGLVPGSRPGKTVAVRADIDALPIPEENDLPFKSTRPGVMHACGHDGHTAIVMGLAQVLAGYRDFPGTIKLIFQSAEEKPPGGARDLVAAGVLDDVDQIIGLHLISNIPTGRAGIIAGPMMANADGFTARIIGQGGHAAAPHQAVDAVVVAAQAVLNLQTIVSRRVDPLRPAVITVGQIEAGYAFNIIAPEARLSGTTRSLDDPVRRQLHDEIHRVLEATAQVHGARAEIDYLWGYPALINSLEPVAVFEEVCRDVLGQDALVDQQPVMGGEDFAVYLRERPGAFLFLGCGNESVGSTWPHHHPRFTIDEAALAPGVAILGETALRLLGA